MSQPQVTQNYANTDTYLDYLYEEKLGRPPDEDGKAYWKEQLESGTNSPELVAELFADSPEGQKHQAAQIENSDSYENYQKDFESLYDNTLNETVKSLDEQRQDGYLHEDRMKGYEQEDKNAIGGLYQEHLHRGPDEDGLDYWYEQLNSGNQTIDEIEKNIQDSAEAEVADENLAFLETEYENKLGRPLGEEGRNYWLTDMAQGASQAEVANNIDISDEKWLGDQYEEIFGRPVDDEGREYWMGDLRGDTDLA